MIHAALTIQDQKICSLQVHGHAFAANPGKDLVCAGVSSIMIGGFNGIDILYPQACDLTMESNRLKLTVRKDSPSLQKILQFLVIQLETMQEVYPKNIQVEKKEV